jgi:thiamine biosynthesis lipoprotein
VAEGRGAGSPAAIAADPPEPAGPHAIAEIMGTVIGVDVRDPAVGASVVEAVFAELREVDRRFSPFKADSEVSRLARGELAESGVSQELRAVLDLCEVMRSSTGGFFDARRHRPDGTTDPTGIVKGWSIERAARLLEAAGARNYAINAGGDVLARGSAGRDRPWRVGIQHPRIADRVAAVLAIHDGAVATSGAYERGEHIVNPHTGRAPVGLLSLSVYGPDLAIVDAFATAAFAMGLDGPGWVARQPGYGALAITADGRVILTPLIDGLLVDAAIA